MSARTDRIAKLDRVIADAVAASQPNRAAKLRDLKSKFEGWDDAKYDEVMALNEQFLATGVAPSGIQHSAPHS